MVVFPGPFFRCGYRQIKLYITRLDQRLVLSQLTLRPAFLTIPPVNKAGLKRSSVHFWVFETDVTHNNQLPACVPKSTIPATVLDDDS